VTVALTVAELLAAVRPVATAMLRPDESRRDESMTVAWKIAGNRGSSGGLVLRGDEREMLHAIAGQ
jgi:hypothetical protein